MVNSKEKEKRKGLKAKLYIRPIRDTRLPAENHNLKHDWQPSKILLILHLASLNPKNTCRHTTLIKAGIF